jgi:hypothetical protein
MRYLAYSAANLMESRYAFATTDVFEGSESFTAKNQGTSYHRLQRPKQMEPRSFQSLSAMRTRDTRASPSWDTIESDMPRSEREEMPPMELTTAPRSNSLLQS